MENMKLNNGYMIPEIGYGTWQSPDSEVTVNGVKAAIACGYRHIDTAAAYKNEESVGEGIKESGIARKNLFVTSKVWNTQRGYEKTIAAFEKTLSDLDWVVCHQANSRIIDHCVKSLHAEPSKFYKNISRHGNTSAASIPIALHEMAESDLLRPGQTLACIGFGGGLTWGGMLLTYEGRK